jgi:hypothetical protein
VNSHSVIAVCLWFVLLVRGGMLLGQRMPGDAPRCALLPAAAATGALVSCCFPGSHRAATARCSALLGRHASARPPRACGVTLRCARCAAGVLCCRQQLWGCVRQGHQPDHLRIHSGHIGRWGAGIVCVCVGGGGGGVETATRALCTMLSMLPAAQLASSQQPVVGRRCAHADSPPLPAC